MPPITQAPAPARLPTRPTPRAERGRELRRGLLAALGLLLVVLGVPAVLVLVVGNPLPTSAPSRSWLTAQVTATTIIKVLAVVLWVAWAHFVVCVAAEWRAARRGTLSSAFALGGGSQLLARRLVAATLLLAGAATLTAGAASPTPNRPAVTATVRSATAAAAAPAAALPDRPATGAAAVKTYVVQPPEGRRYDCLWDIAERTLGDPYRYKEVFELNRDRKQPDGRTLMDADLIQPGWILRMPADARGPGIHTAAAAPVQATAPATPAPTRPAAGAPQATSTQAAVAAKDSGIGLEQGLFGGGLLATGLLLALTARRGPFGEPTEAAAEGALRLAASPVRTDLLERALRTLSAGCLHAGTPLPEVLLAYCSDTELILTLAGVPLGPPPAPWVATEGGGWTLRAADLGDGPTPDAPAPYPALVGLAQVHGYDLLVDLEAAPGLVTLAGDTAQARGAAVSAAVELATNTWSDGVRVTLIGFGDDLAAVAPGSVDAAPTLAGVLQSLEAEARRSVDALRALGVEGVLSGRLARAADRQPARVVVLSGPPTIEEATRLQALVAGGRTTLAVLCVGDAPVSRWRFILDPQGRIDFGVLGVTGQARTLIPAQYEPLLALLRDADTARSEGGATVAAITPRAAVFLDPEPRSAALAAVGPTPHQPTGPVAVDIVLLGPVQVIASGPVDPAALALLTEVVVAAALHREGLHEAVLRSLVWPRGVGDDVLAGTVQQTQQWLGSDPQGRPRLRRDPDGRFVLAADVRCDDDVLRSLAAAATGPDEARLLGSALELIRGEAFTGAAAQRYGWLAFHRAARSARIVGTAVARRAAALATERGDDQAAARALRTGLVLVPTAEPLWRDLLRLTHRDGGPGAAAEVAKAAYGMLDARGLRPEPETDALVHQLAPSVAPMQA